MGYQRSGNTCIDVNECALGNGGCSVNATCLNTVGSRTCTCSAGFTGDGITCTDLNECATSNGGCDANATCTNTPGSRTCTCTTGYAGSGLTCSDINECASGNGGCSADATCTNTIGSRTCACRTGFTGNGLTCADVDECATANGGCNTNATCTNTPGSRTCACRSGFSGDGLSCTDVDECATANGGCNTNATCTNTPGSRTCACNSGYSGNGVTCSDINECATGNGGCSANATCANTQGSRTCACNTGYSGDGLVCMDINECATNNGGCNANATCTNTAGSRTCACNAGFTGDGFTSCVWSDTSLASLAVAPGSVTFSSSTTSYTTTVAAGIASVTVSATVPFAAGVTVTLNGVSYTPAATVLVTLSGPSTPIVFTVRAASGATRVYSLVVLRPLAQQAYLKASNPGASDYFGSDMAISADGTTLVVAASSEDSSSSLPDELASNAGAVYVFVRNAGVWTQQAFLKASNAGADDFFGASVALSADGNTLAVGASGEDSAATGINGNAADNTSSSSGAAYVFTRSGTVWTQQAYLKASNTGAGDRFGAAVALSGDGALLAVGAPSEDSGSSSQTNNTAPEAGAVYVFRRVVSTWSQQAYVKTLLPYNDHQFGRTVAFSADGSTLGVGSPGYSFSSGIVSFFTNPGWAETARVFAPISRDEDAFGSSIALSFDGSTAVVGSPGDDGNATGVNGTTTIYSAYNSGAAFVFTRGTTGGYTQQAFLKGPFVSGNFSTISSGDAFGSSVSISQSGDLVVIAAPGDDSSAVGIDGNAGDNSSTDSGGAFVFGRVAGSWSQRRFVKASNTGAGDFFGAEVLISGDGNTLVCSATSEDSASAGVDGDQTSNALTTSGAAYVFVP